MLSNHGSVGWYCPETPRPTRPPPGPPVRRPLTKNDPRLNLTEEEGQAKLAAVLAESSAPDVEVATDDNVDYLDKEDIGIDEDTNTEPPTQPPAGREGFIRMGDWFRSAGRTNSPTPERLISPFRSPSPRRRIRSRKTQEADEAAASQRVAKTSRKKAAKTTKKAAPARRPAT